MRVRMLGVLLAILLVASGVALAQEATPEPDVALALDETYRADDIVFTVDYPSGWVTRPSFPNGVAIGTSDAALDLWFSDTFEPDDAHAFIGYGTAEEMFEVDAADLTPLELFELAIGADGESDDSELAIDGPHEITVNGRDAAYVTLTQPESQTYLLTVDYGDGHYLSAQIQTGVGSVEAMTDVLLAMVETVRLDDEAADTTGWDALELTESYRDASLPLAFDYPSGWVTKPDSTGVALASHKSLLGLELEEPLAAGDVSGYVGFGSAEAMFGEADFAGLSPDEILETLAQAAPEALEFGEIEALAVNDRRAASITLSLEQNVAFLVLTRYGDDEYLVSLVNVSAGALEDGQALLLRILETVDVRGA
jgi:hypothetical protein